jgi:pyruvate/2-oxoglutarate dehydrogenase complex dihydrolipoamide acyltransferase (E2) component
MIAFDPASFRDPSGRLFRHDGAIFRTASAAALASLRARSSGHARRLEQQGLFVPITVVRSDEAGLSTPEIDEVLGVIDESAVKGPESGVQRKQVQPAQAVADVRASPIATNVAEEHGIDLSKVASSGVGGRVTRDDVRKFVGAKAPGSGATTSNRH